MNVRGLQSFIEQSAQYREVFVSQKKEQLVILVSNDYEALGMHERGLENCILDQTVSDTVGCRGDPARKLNCLYESVYERIV